MRKKKKRDDDDDGESRESDDASITIGSVTTTSATVDLNWIGYFPRKTSATEAAQANGINDAGNGEVQGDEAEGGEAIGDDRGESEGSDGGLRGGREIGGV